MDKLMTGTIIKNARIQKGYTQRELGDILGVSNKAVSRWENGESFPDIILLDVIANTLEISIDELVTGEKNQQPSKETIKEIIKNIILGLLLFSIIILGWCTFGSYSCDIDCYNYYALFIISMMIVAVYAIKDKVSSIKSTDKVGKILFTLSVVSCIYSVLLMLITFELESMGKLKFIKTENIGPLLHYQLIFIFTVNVAITSFYLWKNVRERTFVVSGWITSLSTIFLTFIYDDILHRLTDISYFYSLFFTGTCVVIGIAIIVSLVVKILNKIFNIPI